MYSEIGFIFSPALGSYYDRKMVSNWNNNDNTGNIYQVPIRIRVPDNQNNSQGQNTNINAGQSGQNPTTGTQPAGEDGILIYKSPNAYGTERIKNYLVNNTYMYDDTNEDPYISLIKYFSDRKHKALVLKAADFAYLKDLGVYPINRLWILRRFPDNAIVPNNLLAWGGAVSPISTVVGWMKDKEDQPMLSFNFNEVWVDQNQMIDKVLTEMLRDEFGLKLPMMMSVPGWSQGILFGMLKAMQLTGDFDSKNVPTGNPNVLRIAKMREINNQGLQSKINITLETCYEQKYINGIDPGMALLDIYTNLFKMGTSDQKFVLTNSPLLQKFVGNLQQSSQSAGAWVEFIKQLISAFLKGVTDFIDQIGTSSTSELPPPQGDTGDTNKDQKNKVQTLGTPIVSKDVVGGMGKIATGLLDTVASGTIGKYRWPLKGSIALMTGINTTPWHLTIGNPYSPIINIGNIHVSNVDVKLSNELGFNDMPARIDVTVNAEFGRPLGKQELEKMLNNGYKRIYSTKELSSLNDSQDLTSATSPSGQPASLNVMNKPDQPDTTKSYINRSVNTGGF